MSATTTSQQYIARLEWCKVGEEWLWFPYLIEHVKQLSGGSWSYSSCETKLSDRGKAAEVDAMAVCVIHKEGAK